MFDHCIYFNTVSLGRQLERAWSEAFKPFNLTPPQAFTLRAVLEKPGMLQSELADTLKIARATATRAIDGLEARGLLVRSPTKRDGRECEIHPTDEAIELRVPLNAASAAMTERLKERLGTDNFRDFVEQVKDVSNRIT
jgi:Transcriptional regulators